MTGTNPWLERRVLAYGHQGGAREAPSSTLFAFRTALEAGATALEMDVHATADGHLIVCHDSTVDRTTEGSGRIADLTLAQVQALDNAYWFAPGEVAVTGRPDADYVHRGRAADDPDFRIPTLRSVLEAFPGVFLNLDIKQTAPAVPAYEESLVRLLSEFGRTDDVIVASFNDASTATVARLDPRLATSAGTADSATFWQAFRSGSPLPTTTHRALQIPTHFASTQVASAELIDAAHAAGLAVHFWTIDEPAEMEELIGLGADGIMTDRPAVLAGVLEARGVAYRP
ncbi:MAG: glycerophosphodiester phosphodiesterase [Acidimicrobiales bacterium]